MNRQILKLLPVAVLLLAVSACSEGDDSERLAEGSGVRMTADKMMVSASSPLAVETGLEILRNGGNAVDAAVAVQMVLNVAEPSESGIGGGAFLLYRNAVTGGMTVYDGRETAPAAATANRFLVSGKPLPLWAAVPTGLATGVPGTLAMLHQAHSELGQLPWEELFEPAAVFAEEGIPMPDRLQRQIDGDPSLWIFRDTRTRFVRQRRLDPPVIHNPDLARTFRIIAAEGPDAFYAGPLTAPMINAATSRWPGRSDLTSSDFLNYSPVKRDAVCGNYRNYQICGIPPPSSGGIAILQILGVLEHFPIHEMEPGDPEALHLIAEASRLAFADRARYIGDPAFVTVPEGELIDSVYIASRAAMLDPNRAMDAVRPGVVPGWEPANLQLSSHEKEIQPAGNRHYENGSLHYKNGNPHFEKGNLHYEKETTGTTHFAIADAYGNVVSMTSSIEVPFGNRMMANGYLLNNQLTDFTFQPDRNGFYSPNAVEPGKRPRSSMSPVIVYDEDGKIRLVIGSRGGSRIIGYVVKSLIGVLDWGLPIQEAIALPNFVHRGDVLEIEEGTAWAEMAPLFEEMGHNVRVIPMESGVHGMERTSDHWRGGADPRMDGIAKGD